MEDIKRVFIHELGHYVANELNKIHYGGLGTASIKIFPCLGKIDVYCGETEPARPQVAAALPLPKNRLAQSVLSSVYGCIFQACYTGSTLKKCFEVNGGCDIKSRTGLLKAHEISHYNTDFNTCDEKYLAELREKALLKDFIALEPKEYLQESIKDNYSVDLALLPHTVTPLLSSLQDIYIRHKECYEDIIRIAKAWEPPEA